MWLHKKKCLDGILNRWGGGSYEPPPQHRERPPTPLQHALWNFVEAASFGWYTAPSCRPFAMASGTMPPRLWCVATTRRALTGGAGGRRGRVCWLGLPTRPGGATTPIHPKMPMQDGPAPSVQWARKVIGHRGRGMTQVAQKA